MPTAAASTDIHRFFSATLAESDPELARAVRDELVRQQDQIELIASENVVSTAVLRRTTPPSPAVGKRATAIRWG